MNRHSNAPPGAWPPWARRLVLLCALAAVGLGGYLGWVSLTGSTVAGCGPASGCHNVLNSRWAYWFGIPVSLFGLLNYAAIFGAALSLRPKSPPKRQRGAWMILVTAALLAAAAALWFIAVQIVFIRSLCPFCIAIHAAGLLASILILVHAPFRTAPEKPWQREKEIYLTPSLGRRLAVGALLAWTALAAGPFLHQPKSFVQDSLVGGADLQTNAPTQRMLTLHNGALEIPLHDVPVLGNPAAPNVMISMHDYTCHGCRLMHQPLQRLVHDFSNQLAIVTLPMPLSSNCNHLVTRYMAAHTNACDFALLGLTVWRAKPSALESFNDFVFTPDRPPPVPESAAFARQLVGAEAFDRANQDLWIAARLQLSISLFNLNYRAYGKAQMPQFLIGTNVSFGTRPAEDFYREVVNAYRLTPPPTSPQPTP